ncbi:MAG: hypothetical protein JO126_09370 [Alphaproteobacteria bacterium]|nr:hypothetical protein [Alphaproteobacteria bacterium]MBV8549651.1 hypothetical protein [Alphaproteobacteria bacterium]
MIGRKILLALLRIGNVVAIGMVAFGCLASLVVLGIGVADGMKAADVIVILFIILGIGGGIIIFFIYMLSTPKENHTNRQVALNAFVLLFVVSFVPFVNYMNSHHVFWNHPDTVKPRSADINMEAWSGKKH